MPEKIKTNPTLDRKLWDRVWKKYEKWHIQRYGIFSSLGITEQGAIQRILNDELQSLNNE